MMAGKKKKPKEKEAGASRSTHSLRDKVDTRGEGMITGKTHILYVDDEQALLDLCKVFLERNGEFAVTTLTSVQEAIALSSRITRLTRSSPTTRCRKWTASSF